MGLHPGVTPKQEYLVTAPMSDLDPPYSQSPLERASLSQPCFAYLLLVSALKVPGSVGEASLAGCRAVVPFPLTAVFDLFVFYAHKVVTMAYGDS